MITNLMENRENESGSFKNTYKQPKKYNVVNWVGLLIQNFQKLFSFREH